MMKLVNYLLSFSCILYASCYFSTVDCATKKYRIGLLLHENQYQQEILFKWAIHQVNRRGLLNDSKLEGLVRKITPDDSWDAEKEACDLIEQGAIALIGPSNEKTSLHIDSICDTLDVPHFNLITKGVTFPSGSRITKIISDAPGTGITIDLSISYPALIRANLDVVRKLEWNDFVYLYEQEHSLYHLQESLNEPSLKTNEINMRVLRFDPMKPYRATFWKLKAEKVRYIMLDVKCSNLRTVLRHAQQVSMMTEYDTYLIVCLDTQTIDLEDFKYSRSRIIWLSSFHPESNSAQVLKSSVNDYDGGLFNSNFNLPTNVLRDGRDIKIESALIYDSIETIALSLASSNSLVNIDDRASCKEMLPLSSGITLVNHMKTDTQFEGLTGWVRFNGISGRSDHTLFIMTLNENTTKTIGNWSLNDGRITLNIDKNEFLFLQRGDPTLYESDSRDMLIVTSIKNEPFFMNKQTTKVETGNARYEGYVIDLIDELSRIVGFDYQFKEVDDGKYGKFNTTSEEWNGMIREVMIGKADMAIGDLSITSSREEAVDFTLPFMSTGISILFKKPTTKELELFSFLSPFEDHVWVYVCGAYIGVSTLLFIVSRISPYEWADPHPCRQEDKILRNQFSMTNSFWFTIAALMQQGSDLAPRSLSTRLVAAIWYFFTLIMISSYTANLAAFLTVEKVIYPIERAQDLYKHPQNIQYGCIESGASQAFFNNSKSNPIFNKMYYDMKNVESNEEGKTRVDNGNYAFFMESINIEYVIERNCNLTQIGGLLDSKGYGIAWAKNSTRKRDYRTKLSEGILSLQESGMLEVLYNRWWKEKRGGGACDIDDSQGGEGVKELTLANVGGVFVVLGMGITISFLLCALELFVKSCQLVRTEGGTKWSQLKRRVSFALSLSDNY